MHVLCAHNRFKCKMLNQINIKQNIFKDIPIQINHKSLCLQANLKNLYLKHQSNMNTPQRINLLRNFNSHINQKLKKIQRQQPAFMKTLQLQNKQIDISKLPEIDIVSDLTLYHRDIDKCIKQTYDSIGTVMQALNRLKNKKQNTSNLLDILTSIMQVKDISYSLKVESANNPEQLYKTLSTYYSIRSKTYHCQKYIEEIDSQIAKIQIKLRQNLDQELTKTDSSNIKEVARVLQLIKSHNESNQRKKSNQQQQIGQNQDQVENKEKKKKLKKMSEISQFYVNMVKKELVKYEQELFNITIVGNVSSNEANYIFFDIAKNALKVVVSLIETYQTNILKLEGQYGLHQVSVNIFSCIMKNLIAQILVREKKYFQIDKINISRNKLALKDSQYNLLKKYFKEFNAIWNQIQRFRIHIYNYLPQQYEHLSEYNKELTDITNSTWFVEFNFSIILYFQAFFRHQLDRLLKKSPFIVSLWQLQESFLKDVRLKKEYKNNLAGQDFIEEMILKFSDGIKKSFETLNILIISALINFVNHNLVYEDSFYAFTQLLNRCLARINDTRAVEGLILLLNTVCTYPKAIQSAFSDLQIPEQLPTQRIQNQVSQLVSGCKQKTGQFIMEAIELIISNQIVQTKLQQNKYMAAVQMFKELEKDLLELYVFKLSKAHVEIILENEFSQENTKGKSFSNMDVINLEKQIRDVIKFYQTKSHSVRANFRKILDFIEILSIESEEGLQNILEQLGSRYAEDEVKRIWKLRSSS